MGNPDAAAVLDRCTAGVADVIRMLGLAVDPRTIIIGGGVAQLGEPLLAAVTGLLRGQAITSPFLAALDLAARVRLVPARDARRRRRDQGCAVGALRIAAGRRRDGKAA